MITLPAYEYLDELSPDELNRLILQEILKDSPDLLLVQGCIQAGAPIDAQDVYAGWTLLESAAWNGRLEVINALIQGRASLDAQNFARRTALHYAAWGNQPKVVNALLSAGASKDMKDEKGKTPWDLAPETIRTQCPQLKP